MFSGILIGLAVAWVVGFILDRTVFKKTNAVIRESLKNAK